MKRLRLVAGQVLETKTKRHDLNKKIEIQMNGAWKLGVNEVVGLKEALTETIQPIVEVLKDKAYWADVTPSELEYNSRDGFIPHSHNKGGVEISFVVPSVEQYSFCFLEFGECDGCNEDCTKCTATEDGSRECIAEIDGHLDALLRIIIMFEGINDDGKMEFYINVCGGNGDAPYFRLNHLSDLFEASFEASSVRGVKRAASKHIKAILKLIGGK